MFSSLMDSPRQYQHPELEIGKSGEAACPRANRLMAPSSVMRISTSQMSAYFVAKLLRMVKGHMEEHLEALCVMEYCTDCYLL